MQKQSRDYRGLLGHVGKLLLATALIYWLISTGRLNFSQLGTAYSIPGIVFGAAFMWISGVAIFATWRWLLLMRGIGLECRFWRCCQLTMIGGFFNTVLFGTVGGDLIRGVYAYRDNRSRGRAAPAMTVIMDRITGLYGLFFIGVGAILTNLSAIESQPALGPAAVFVVGIFCLLTLGFISILVPVHAEISQIFSRLADFRYVPRSLVNLYLAFRSYREKKRYLLYAFLISIVIQAQVIMFYWYVASVVTGRALSLDMQALIVPIGALITAVPISPGGLGVGHAAFERLYALIGISDGANIFNIIIIGQMAMNLLGSIPYLLLRSHERDSPVVD
jgi:uncharacterized protein (TIRG00374 family)